MKAISLLQPWATLIVIGVPQLLVSNFLALIHASQSMKHTDLVAKEYFNEFLPHRIIHNNETGIDTIVPLPNELPYGAIIGKVYLASVNYTQVVVGSLSVQEKAFGDYNYGRYAWELKDPVQFDKPIPYKGSLSIWEFPDGLLPILTEK